MIHNGAQKLRKIILTHLTPHSASAFGFLENPFLLLSESENSI